MQLKRIAAVAIASALAFSSTITSSASAATVEIITDNLCKFTFTNQDFDLVVEAAADPEQGSLQRLNELFPQIDGGLDLLVSEFVGQLVATKAFEGEKLSPAAKDDFSQYLIQGVDDGFTQNELMSMLLGAGMSPMLVNSLNSQKSIYVGTIHLSKTNAQQWIDLVEGFPGNYGYDFEAKTYNGQPISNRVLTVLEPSIAIHENLVEVYSVPFDNCIAGVPSTGGGDNGGDNGSGGNGGSSGGDGDGGGGGNGNGNGNGNGGDGDDNGGNGNASNISSSFGSS